MKEKQVITVQSLRKQYGSVAAVDGMSFRVKAGEIFGMVGPNGAGKTTAIECIEGLRTPDSGDVRVLGMDPHRNRQALHRRIGVQLQESSLPSRIKVREALDLFASFYPKALDRREMEARLGLGASRDVAYTKLSGGQKQRLFIGLALIHNPELVFLDELTTGLDPQARRAMWNLVQRIRDQGKTVFLSTHFMEEAETLCERVAIVDCGQIVALNTPDKLIRDLGADSRITVAVDSLPAEVKEEVTLLAGVTRMECSENRLIVFGKGGSLVADVVRALTEKGVGIRDLRIEQPNLEDVFLALTGRTMRD